VYELARNSRAVRRAAILFVVRLCINFITRNSRKSSFCLPALPAGRPNVDGTYFQDGKYFIHIHVHIQIYINIHIMREILPPRLEFQSDGGGGGGGDVRVTRERRTDGILILNNRHRRGARNGRKKLCRGTPSRVPFVPSSPQTSPLSLGTATRPRVDAPVFGISGRFFDNRSDGGKQETIAFLKSVRRKRDVAPTITTIYINSHWKSPADR